MSFEHGSVSLRLFYPRSGSSFPEQPFDKFAADAIQSVESMTEPCVGWSTGRHLLDRNITEESATVAGRIRLSLVKAVKKIPTSLFKAECKQEELAVMAAKGADYLNRKERKEIKEAVEKRMLPAMPPTLSAIDLVWDANPQTLYTTACSVAQADLLGTMWAKTTGQQVYPYLPLMAALKVGQLENFRSLKPTSFSPEVADEALEQDLGTEFLTWLWYFSEECGGMNGGFAFALSGPFTFIHEGDGAHVVVIRKGNPGIASEAKSALMAGKKLKKAKLTVAKDKDMWTCSIDGSEWTFGSLKLPKGEQVDPSGILQERMASIATFMEAFEGLFLKFVSIRIDPKGWSAEVAKIKQWVADRATKA